MKTSLKFSLSTAIKLMFVGALLVWANTQPSLRPFVHVPFPEIIDQNLIKIGSEMYTVDGYGWPLVWMHPVPAGNSWGYLIVNLFVAAIVLALSGIFFEAKHWKKWLALLLAVGFGGLTFIALSAVASAPDGGPVSLSRSFQPWWQSWRIGASAFVLAWTLTTLSFLNEVYLTPRLKLQPNDK